MGESSTSAEAGTNQLTITLGGLSSDPSNFYQTPMMSCPVPWIGLRVENDNTSKLPPDRSSFDSFLILPDAALPSSVHTAPRKSPRKLCHLLSTQNPWFLGIINAILLLVVISAIVATLYIHAGQPIPQWPFHITINAMISIYAVILKASMAFIQASCIGQM